MTSSAGAISQRPCLCGAEQRRKAGVGIEGRPAQPVDRAVAADQRRGLAIADQPIIFDPAGQGVSPPSAFRSAPRDRSRVAAFERGDVDRRRDLLERHRKPPPPVRMFVDGAGNIGLVDHAQQILQRDRKQPRLGPREKTRAPNTDRCGRWRDGAARRPASPAHASAHRRFRRDRCRASASSSDRRTSASRHRSRDRGC